METTQKLSGDFCKACEHKIESEGKYRRGFNYPFVCMQCEDLIMVIESYEEEIS